jgi:diaminopimelate epimerase
MKIEFTKYHGTGNDFILIDDRKEVFDITDHQLINQMCHRRFGIGADGLILLRNAAGFDFQMVYFNSDGNQSSMCGNGGRCIVHFAHALGIFERNCNFLAIDGPHNALFLGDNVIKLKMGDVDHITNDGKAFVMNTGSPHYILMVENIETTKIKKLGASIRYSEKYLKDGINVNFLELKERNIKVATYERGVEDETYSCGTGVTASAIAANKIDALRFFSPVKVLTKGGKLKVYFTYMNKGIYEDVWLEGPAIMTFKGRWTGSV